MEKLVNKLTNAFLYQGIISPDQIDWCNYLLEAKLEFVIALLPLLVLGTLISGLVETLIFCFGVYFLRKRTNGYHANTFLGCLIQSTVCEILCLAIAPWFSRTLLVILLICATTIIVMLAPVNNSQIHLDSSEITALRKSVRVRITIFLVLSAVLFFLNSELFSYAVLSMVFVAILLILSKIGFGQK